MKDFIRSYRSYISVLIPIIVLFLIIIAYIRKDSKISYDYWPTNWKELKKTNFSSGSKYNPSELDKVTKDALTVRFREDIFEACEMQKKIDRGYIALEMKQQKAIYEFNIRVGNITQFNQRIYKNWVIAKPSDSIFHLQSRLAYDYVQKLLWKDFEMEKYRKDRETAIANHKEIMKGFQDERDYYDYFLSEVDKFGASEEYQSIKRLKNLQRMKLHAANVEVIRQTGDKNWKLYSRWNGWGVRDLYSYYYTNKYFDRKVKDIGFRDFLEKKGIRLEGDIGPSTIPDIKVAEVCKNLVKE